MLFSYSFTAQLHARLLLLSYMLEDSKQHVGSLFVMQSYSALPMHAGDGHGTHVASIAVGRNVGVAKEGQCRGCQSPRLRGTFHHAASR